MKLLMIWSLIRRTIDEFLEESPFQLAAALSYYTVLSLSPLVLVVVGVAGLVWSEDAVRAQLLHQIEQLAGPAGAETVSTVLARGIDPGRDRISVAIGIATLLIGATTVFAQLQAALNQIWNVRAAPSNRVLWSLMRTRLLSLALVLALGFLLLVSLVVSAVLAGLHHYLSAALPAGGAVWQVVNVVVSLAVVAILVGMIFKALPDVRIAWSDVWFGAMATSVLFTLGKSLIGLYLGHASIASSYGAAGSLVVFLVWVYYSSLIILFGAQVTQTYARLRGVTILPA
ncbi:MAG TPA: YihY/virulence factor BrkB family protein, partial [Candidatus Binatia bacterium]|nr:YihY/virulence factor BrkB family protein [Candidatus Binatia bacterium]